MNFTQIPDVLPYPPKIRAKLSTIHADIITYAIDTYQDSAIYKSRIIMAMNIFSYYILTGDTIPNNWSSQAPFENMPLVYHSDMENVLGKLLIVSKGLVWDIKPVETVRKTNNTASITNVKQAEFINTKQGSDTATPKEYLYIKPPTVPQFDTNKPWLNIMKNGETYTIYSSLPLIPTNQSQISITTNIDSMTDLDFLKLFPNQFIRTRASAMYEPCDTLTLDTDLGNIIIISGFTTEQIRENIIKYPHFYKLMRIVDGKCVSFYSSIEIDGILHDTLSIWDSLPDSQHIPKTSEYIKEYVVRRYLLERDVLGIKHKYPLFGTLEPFLTLFTTANDYKKFGYNDAIYLARSCVAARVNYKQSRNPILRMVYNT